MTTSSEFTITKTAGLSELDSLINKCISLLQEAKLDAHKLGPRHYYSFQALELQPNVELSASKPTGVAADLAELFCTMQDLCTTYDIPLAKAIEDIGFYHKYNPRIIT